MANRLHHFARRGGLARAALQRYAPALNAATLNKAS
jgi:hypothetical protein